MKLDIKLFGVHARDNMISETVQRLGLSYETDVFYDDRPNGGCALYTAEKAWRALAEEGVTHRMVLQDDIYPCDNFSEICTKMINAHPDAVFSLFPYTYRDADIPLEDTPYINAYMVSGLGNIMPIQYVKDCFDWIDKTLPPDVDDDWAITQWCQARGILMLTTIPSTVQHIGDDSLLNKGMPIRRTKHFSLNPVANWDSVKINNFTAEETLFANYWKAKGIKLKWMK